AKRSGSQILPIDSEHSAIFQCLVGEAPERVTALILTASGGPFLRMTQRDLKRATVERALAHPTWQMGAKNSVDSATMMNKGLEVIEASRFFNQPGANVHVLVHPQSIIHGMVVFSDGNVKVQLSPPDMRLPIGYALSYPERLRQPGVELDPLVAAGGNPGAAALRYEFERPDLKRFPCLSLAYDALAFGGTAPATLSAANEIAVEAFIKGEIAFTSIPAVVERVMKLSVATELTLSRVREADARARREAIAAVDALRQEIEV
ncbi:MAG: 1-deoxy-D-xylulose-5-phosphate reductoisomerase, partial [Candidatus Eremiobacteraeota bacterium]|nr:1-deoxy-D-xylulose-5-phosphate reductoisomerase [Candidatus Eremiobacteraeota bacterium]